MTRWYWHLVIVAVGGLSVACASIGSRSSGDGTGGSSAGETTGEDGQTTGVGETTGIGQGTEGDSSSGEGVTTGEEEEIVGGLSGRVLNVQGEPAIGASVIICSDFCVAADVDEAGVYDVQELPVGPYKVRVVAGGQPLMAMQFPQTVVADTTVEAARDLVMIGSVEEPIAWPKETGGEVSEALVAGAWRQCIIVSTGGVASTYPLAAPRRQARDS